MRLLANFSALLRTGRGFSSGGIHLRFLPPIEHYLRVIEMIKEMFPEAYSVSDINYYRLLHPNLQTNPSTTQS